MKLELQSERYAATGNVSGSGIRKSLGTPTLDPLQILIRESVQNAWDARHDDAVPVRFSVHIRTLTASQQKALETMLSDLPATGPARTRLEASLARPSLTVIELNDRETYGLAGPVRADEEVRDDERNDFVNFFRNVGSPRDRELGAGTYGYGKSSLFRLSRCGVVVGYTRTSNHGRSTTRLMAAAIGDPFEYKRRRYTGRHWWGRKHEDGLVDPITSSSADSAAQALGVTRRDADDHGTCLLVIDPEFEERSLLQAGNAVAECLAWYFWPKMLRHGNKNEAMRFEVAVDGTPVPVPDVRSFPPLEIFVAAMANAKSESALRIVCERPKQTLGRLGLAKSIRRERLVLDTGSDTPLVPPQCACIALMRPAELVVKYLQVPAMPSDMVEYGGVFICDELVEPFFAEAEPPAHDDWVPDYLEGHGKTFVRVAMRRIAEHAAHYSNPAPTDEPPPEQASLATLGDALGDILLGQAGPRLGSVGGGKAGGNTESGPGSPGKSRSSISVSEPEPFGFAVVRRTPCAVFRTSVELQRRQGVVLEAKPLVVLEGGAAEEPEEDDGARIIGWLDAKGHVVAQGPTLRLAGPVNEQLLIAVSVQGDAAVSVTIAQREGRT